MPNETKPDFLKMEKDILNFWEKEKCFKRLCDKNKNRKDKGFIK